ncbi:hypothetical protein HPB47_019959 [Ixodes persulcatus]|uniref:Uncharacterized protein n=1 Tax=Ixodes persulcatus TaxID=34615 RepID=A0AC60QJ13_IXOPE|nr:hypothetical protein HPB47_019959 [Ixodes persulcatus]
MDSEEAAQSEVSAEANNSPEVTNIETSTRNTKGANYPTPSGFATEKTVNTDAITIASNTPLPTYQVEDPAKAEEEESEMEESNEKEMLGKRKASVGQRVRARALVDVATD